MAAEERVAGGLRSWAAAKFAHPKENFFLSVRVEPWQILLPLPTTLLCLASPFFVCCSVLALSLFSSLFLSHGSAVFFPRIRLVSRRSVSLSLFSLFARKLPAAMCCCALFVDAEWPVPLVAGLGCSLPCHAASHVAGIWLHRIASPSTGSALKAVVNCKASVIVTRAMHAPTCFCIMFLRVPLIGRLCTTSV